ncbi:hypothetical protein DL95DRAFT_380800 [Leptodontidium sp. 2 PMI_412]|nr:hypothetical protein DL95DRAFT_380800 [Leptodontidium sp. 2 PMI_412]
MSLRHLLRRPLPPLLRTSRQRPPPRPNASQQTPRYASSSSSSTTTPRNRIDRILTRLPRFLHPYTTALRTAPISHLTSFLILHEITAIVPLVGLATTFHYAGWLPEMWVQGRWVNEGVERFGRYFGRRGLFGFGPTPTPAPDTGIIPATGNIANSHSTASKSPPAREESVGGSDPQVEEYVQVQGKWQASERGTRILVEVATAYAITKVLLPVRVLVSVWGAPWFARAVLGRFGRLVRWRGRGGGGGVSAGNMGRWEHRGGGGGVGGMSGAAGTGATGGGVIGIGKARGKKGS